MTREPLPDDGFERRALCVTCRTPLAKGEPCDAGNDHEVLVLTAPADRARVVSAAWMDTRRYASGDMRVLGGGCIGGVLGFAGMWALCNLVLRSQPPLFVLLCVMVLFAMLGMWVTPRGAPRAIVTGRRPRGASARPRPATNGSVGTVVRPDGFLPVRCARLVVLKLAATDGGGITLRDAWSEGFEVELPGGVRVHIPAGRIRADGPRAAERALSEIEIEAHLCRVDPLRTPGAHAEPDDLFPYDEGYVIEIRSGDRVKILGEIDNEIASESGTYRIAASPPRPRPRGVPHVRLVRRAEAGPRILRAEPASDPSDSAERS